jgi:hypothetical protein
MFSVDLLVWLLIVALVTAGWSLATPRHKGSQVLVRRERLHDITPVFHFSDRDVGRRYRKY